MTNLTKPISRVAQPIGDGVIREAGKLRQVVVTLQPPYILKFRAKGCKKSYSLTYAKCYTMAVKAHVADAKRLKKKKRVRGRVKSKNDK
ncbi:hypothetical protein KAR91_22800 [Candidatus Pacearchaeota archaeon]|nr:hypothetical protein [Candidatus Pacearchaeota archaeon]